MTSKYSIEELMHFNRCMFLDDFIRDLTEAGLEDAWFYRSLFKRLVDENRFDILTVSQELINSADFSKARDKVLGDFFERREKTLDSFPNKRSILQIKELEATLAEIFEDSEMGMLLRHHCHDSLVKLAERVFDKNVKNDMNGLKL